MEEEMRFINFIKPSLSEGKYKISVKQEVTKPQNCVFDKNEDFYVSGNAYILEKEDVFSVFPSENERGEFADILPFIVTDKKTFPWNRFIAADKNGVPIPWVALIVVTESDNAQEKDMVISDLLNPPQDGVYFPGKTAVPSVVKEKQTDLCHVIDLPVGTYHGIMPTLEDLPYLCHARCVNLGKTEDSICAKDGYFSVICANRFLPSGNTEDVKSTVHLVSLLGHAAPEIPKDCQRVRLVSLYHWDVFSKKKSEENFASVIDALKNNCGVIGKNTQTDLQKQGYSVKKHITRTGEQTYSLYRPPLIPFHNTENLDMSNIYTADGRLIYDKEIGIFDVTYSAAWQLGRLLTLDNPSVAESMLRYHKSKKIKAHQCLLKANINYTTLGLEELTVRLVEDKILCRERAE